MQNLFLSISTIIGAMGIMCFALKLMQNNTNTIRYKHIADIKNGNDNKAFYAGVIYALEAINTLKAYHAIVQITNSKIYSKNNANIALCGAAAAEIIFIWIATAIAYYTIAEGNNIISSTATLGTAFILTIVAKNQKTVAYIANSVAAIAIIMIAVNIMAVMTNEICLTYNNQIQNTAIYLNNTPIALFIGILLGTIVNAWIQNTTIIVLTTIVVATYCGMLPFAIGVAIGAPLGILFPAAYNADNAATKTKRAIAAHVTAMILAAAITAAATHFMIYFAENQDLIVFAIIPLIITINMLVILPLAVWMTKPLDYIFNIIIPHNPYSKKRLELIDSDTQPWLALMQAEKEIENHARRTYKMVDFIRESMLENDQNKKKALYQRVAKYRLITDRVESEITDFICSIVTKTKQSTYAKQIKTGIARIGKIEYIVDSIYNISLVLQNVDQENHTLSQTQKNILNNILIDIQRLQHLSVMILQNQQKQQEEDNRLKANEIYHKIDSDILQLKAAYHPYNQNCVTEILTYCSIINKKLKELI